jgi:hypothetical protein
MVSLNDRGKNECAYRYEIEVLCVMKARMKGENEVAPIQLCESSLLIDDGAECDFSSSGGVFVDGFESIQVGCMFLSHEVNGRICSRTQGAQELVIIEAWGDISTLDNGDSSSLKSKRGLSKKGCSDFKLDGGF